MSDPCQTILQDCQPAVVVNHQGDAGPEGPQGPPGDITTDDIAVTDNALALWDGTDGSKIKDSGVLLSALATVAALALKQDAVAGKGLSQEDFTTVLKAKLDALSNATFRGTYVSLAVLEVAVPEGNDGDWAHVIDTGEPLSVYRWNDVDAGWKLDESGSLTGADIAALLFAEPDTNNFTDTYKDLVDNAVPMSAFNAALAAAGLLSNDVVTDASAARTLATTDSGRFLRLTATGGITLTLPNDATAGWDDNVLIRFSTEGTTGPTFSLGAGVTLIASSKIAGLSQNDVFSIKRLAADTWIVWEGA